MTRVNKAVSLAIVGVIVIVLILLVAFGVYLDLTLNKASTIGSTTSTSQNSTSYEGSSSIFFNGSVTNTAVYAVACALTHYQVWSIESVSNSTTIGTTSTQRETTSYSTTTAASESIGYITSPTIQYSGTLTGALAEWQVLSCTYIK